MSGSPIDEQSIGAASSKRMVDYSKTRKDFSLLRSQVATTSRCAGLRSLEGPNLIEQFNCVQCL